MPIKVKESKTEREHILRCEDDSYFNTYPGKIMIVFLQKEILDMIDARIKTLYENLDEIDLSKIPTRRRERILVKMKTRIDEVKKVRKMIVKAATYRRGNWQE